MARIASQSKGGYYATPVSEITRVARGLRLQGTEANTNLVNLLDPCCGEGEALSILARELYEQGNLVRSYGVELEEGRAEKAKSVLSHVLQEGYEFLRTEPSYNAVWLNPPYDMVFHERTELRFLRTLSSKSKNVFAPKGLLMLCIPQYVLKDVSLTLSSRFHDISVYRFTDEEYPVFKQVIVFGYYGRPSHAVRRENQKMLRELSDADPSKIPTTEEIEEGQFVIYEAEKEIETFRAGRLRVEELKKDLAQSLLKEEAMKHFAIDRVETIMKNPVLPLKPTHGGIAVASGAIGGNMSNHIIVGVTKQIVEKEENYNDDGVLTHETITKHYKSIVRVFSTEFGVLDLN